LHTARKPGERRSNHPSDWDTWISHRGQVETQLAQHILAAEHALKMLLSIENHLLTCMKEVLCEILEDIPDCSLESVRWSPQEAIWMVGEELKWSPSALDVRLQSKNNRPSSAPTSLSRRSASPILNWMIPLHAACEIHSLPPPPDALKDHLVRRPDWQEELQVEGRWQWAKHRDQAQLAYRVYRQHERQYLAECEPWKSVWAQILMSGRVVRLHNHTCHIVREASRWPLASENDIPHCIGMTLPKPRSTGWQVREFRLQATLRAGSVWKIYGIRESFEPSRGIRSFPFETTVSPGILLDALRAYLFPWPNAPFDRSRGPMA
jgi:hypothetical protein